MRARESATIKIKRPLYKYNGQMYSGDVATVPITAKSRRKFSLMSEDSITLEFSLPTATTFKIGDFVDDELFGRFFLTADQMPKYNATTGGYDYTLKFDAEYRLWNNWVHCLVSEGERMEASWSLTDRLEVHAQQVVENLASLGFDGFSLDISASNSADVKYISYNGVSVLAAMQSIADTYSCEWWVTMTDKTIHFGKCSVSNTPLVMSVGENVESMEIANNRNTFANRLYVYGGTQNIPEDYDKALIFTADGNDGNEWWDTNRPLTLDMLDTTGEYITPITFGAFAISQSGNTITLTSSSTSGFHIEPAGALIRGNIMVNVLDNLSIGVNYSLEVKLYYTGTPTTIYSESGAMPTPQLYRNIELNKPITSNDYTKVEVVVTLINTGSGTMTIGLNEIESDLQVERKGMSLRKTLRLIGTDASYFVTFNPHGIDWALEEAGHFTFDNGTPSGFVLGTQYTIEPLAFDVPQGYYTRDYSVGTLSKVGEGRLHLPLDDYPHRYIQTNGLSLAEMAVERVIVFNNVFPKLSLKIAEVRQEIKRTKVEHEDGTVTYDNWPQYHIKLCRTNDAAFTFNTRWLLAGEVLRIHFTPPTTNTGQEGFLLSGMSFEVGFDNATQEYTIIRNEDYGVALPEGYLKPTEGDTCFLSGWNPRAINSLGLVDEAEGELATKAQEYLAAMEQGQFTFTCRMMSDWPFTLDEGIPFLTSEGDALLDAGGNMFCVSDGYISYQLPLEGTQVTINHAALPNGSKTSRIIGYDLALDMPYDTPVYTIGETKAYSRLAQIEKEITQLTR